MTGYFHFGNNHFNSAVSDRRICKTRFIFSNLNSLLCEIFTYLAVKILKPRIQRVFI